jgi:hypothetical protein
MQHPAQVVTVHIETYGPTQDLVNELDAAVEELHNRPLYIIASNQFPTLEHALDQLKEWFRDGTLDPLTAVYQITHDTEDRECVMPFFVISASEFDTFEEAKDQVYFWHTNQILDENAFIYKTKLKQCFELEIGLVPATVEER